jgi:hypothetical protein
MAWMWPVQEMKAASMQVSWNHDCSGHCLQKHNRLVVVLAKIDRCRVDSVIALPHLHLR